VLVAVKKFFESKEAASQKQRDPQVEGGSSRQRFCGPLLGTFLGDSSLPHSRRTGIFPSGHGPAMAKPGISDKSGDVAKVAADRETAVLLAAVPVEAMFK